MTIEAQLEQLNKNVVALIAALAGSNMGKVEPVKTAPIPAAPAVTTATAEATTAAPATPPAQQEVTVAAAMAAMQNLAKAKNRDAVVEVLAKHKATKVSNLPPAELAGFIKDANELAAS